MQQAVGRRKMNMHKGNENEVSCVQHVQHVYMVMVMVMVMVMDMDMAMAMTRVHAHAHAHGHGHGHAHVGTTVLLSLDCCRTTYYVVHCIRSV